MSTRPVAAALAALLLAGVAHAWDPLRSGPQLGAKNNRSGFRPGFVAGPGTAHPHCPV